MNAPDKCPKCHGETTITADGNITHVGVRYYDQNYRFCLERQRDALAARVKELEGELKVYRAPIEWAGEDVKRRVAYLNSLRSVVSRRCPVNKMGAPLVTDFDLLAAGVEEVVEGFELARKGVERL